MEKNFNFITNPVINQDKMKSYYGIDIIGSPSHNYLIEEYAYWIKIATLHPSYKKFIWEPEKLLILNRFAFEMFMDAYNRIPIRHAASQLGIRNDS